MIGAPALEVAPEGPPACVEHAGNASVTRCVRCLRPVCHVCVFTFGSATYCPECLLSGPTRDESSGVLWKGVLSLVLAACAAAITAVFTLGGAQRFGDGVANVLSYPWMASTIGGVALALVARDGARRRGSVLPTIGLVANGILLAIQLVLVLVGTFGN